MERLLAGDIVKHFKRDDIKDKDTNPMYLYQITGIVTHTETKEKLVSYMALYDYSDDNMEVKLGQEFVRPYDMFMSEVDHDKYPNVSQKYRFQKCGRIIFPCFTSRHYDLLTANLKKIALLERMK